MLCLFGSGEYGTKRTFLKVGYTDDLETRVKQYKLHNPGGKMIDTREGDEMLELKLHLRLTYHKEDFLDEWFYDFTLSWFGFVTADFSIRIGFLIRTGLIHPASSTVPQTVCDLQTHF